jgi:hypothetical protein
MTQRATMRLLHAVTSCVVLKHSGLFRISSDDLIGNVFACVTEVALRTMPFWPHTTTDMFPVPVLFSNTAARDGCAMAGVESDSPTLCRVLANMPWQVLRLP